MSEGSLEAPIRHPIEWQNPDFIDPEKIDAELRRVFDICHGCRRCFNLCDSFPRLFDLIDDSETGELDSVDSKDFKPVVDACTLCDMCFMTKCPYVPPHEFNLDFPHLMLRYRAAEHAQGKTPFVEQQLVQTDRNGKLFSPVSGVVNWATDRDNRVTRTVMQTVTKVHKDAAVPKFHGQTLVRQARKTPCEVNREAPAFGRKAVIYATCFVNYNNPDIGNAARAVLAHNGVETKIVYPACCGMPLLEHGNLEKVAARAEKISAELGVWIDKGYDVIALVPSCALMMKFEWPLILPGHEGVDKLSKATFDAAEYIVDIARKEGVAPGLRALDGGVTVHLACHARAQNMGPKAAEMLRLIPGTEVAVIERCSGHGGSWGMMVDNFEVAIKVGKPVARQAVKNAGKYIASECPLAAEHVLQGMEFLVTGDAAGGDAAPGLPDQSHHPIQLMARAWDL